MEYSGQADSNLNGEYKKLNFQQSGRISTVLSPFSVFVLSVGIEYYTT